MNKIPMGVWRGGSVMKSIGCLSRGPGLSSRPLLVAHNHLELEFQDISCTFPASMGIACMWH